MKRSLLALLSTALLASPAFAIVGGPFDNNVFYGAESSGTYQGVLTGKNISGVAIFGTSSTSSANGSGVPSSLGVFGSGGRALIFVEGEAVTADVNSTADFKNRRITSAFEGSVGLATVAWPPQRQRETDGSTTVTTWILEGALEINGMISSKIVRTFPSLEFAGKDRLRIRGIWPVLRPTFGGGIPTYRIEDVDEERPVRFTGVRTSTQSPVITTTLTQVSPVLRAEREVIPPPTPTPTPAPSPTP